MMNPQLGKRILNSNFRFIIFLNDYHNLLLDCGVKSLKGEKILIVSIMIFLTLSFYLAILSLETGDQIMKEQLTTFAVYSIILTVALFSCLTLYLGFKNLFPSFSLL